MANKQKQKKNAFDVILDVFAWISFVLAFIVCTTVILATFSSAENGKPIFGHKLLIVGSDSMKLTEQSDPNEPIHFETGDLIIIKEISDYSEIQVGDVITFYSFTQNKTISHKIRDIRYTNGGEIINIETYGVATGVSDEERIDLSQIIGKYVGQVPVVGHIFTFLKTPAGYFTSILIPCVLLIIFFSIKVGKLIAKKQLAERYDNELETLQTRLSQLENKDGMVMDTNAQELAVTTDTTTATQEGQPAVAGQATTSPVAQAQPQVYAPQQAFIPTQGYAPQGYVYPQQGVAPQYTQAPVGMPTPPIPNFNGFEFTVNALNRTIDSLTRTIENLTSAVGKPVDTLARTVEVLATGSAKPSVVQNVETIPPVAPIQPQEQPVAPIVPVVPTEEQPLQPTQPTEEEQPVVLETPTEEVVEEETSVTEVEVERQPTEEGETSIFKDFKSHEKIPFNKKLLSLGSEVKEYFSDVHNELISYKKVHHRISSKGVAYRLGRKTLAKMTVRGKTLKLFLALNVDDFSRSVYFQEDSSNVKMYEDVPFTVKIKSNRAKNNAIKLVTSVAEQNNLVKNDKFEKENVIEQLNENKY